MTYTLEQRRAAGRKGGGIRREQIHAEIERGKAFAAAWRARGAEHAAAYLDYVRGQLPAREGVER